MGLNLTVITKDGVEHKLVEGKLIPPVICPAHIHEKALRKINETRQRQAEEADNQSDK